MAADTGWPTENPGLLDYMSDKPVSKAQAVLQRLHTMQVWA